METVAPYLPSLGWILMLASLALTVILGLILAFHWFRYALNVSMSVLTLGVYAGVSIFLLIGMATALTLFLSTL